MVIVGLCYSLYRFSYIMTLFVFSPMEDPEEDDGESMESPSRTESNFDESGQDRQIGEERRAKLREIEVGALRWANCKGP